MAAGRTDRPSSAGGAAARRAAAPRWSPRSPATASSRSRPQVDRVGWWDGSAQVGDPYGSTVLAGHVDSREQGLGVFAALLEVARRRRGRGARRRRARGVPGHRASQDLRKESLAASVDGAGPARPPPAGAHHLHRGVRPGGAALRPEPRRSPPPLGAPRPRRGCNPPRRPQPRRRRRRPQPWAREVARRSAPDGTVDVVGRNRGRRAAGCLLLLVVLLVAGAGPADGSASAAGRRVVLGRSSRRGRRAPRCSGGSRSSPRRGCRGTAGSTSPPSRARRCSRRPTAWSCSPARSSTAAC